MDKKVSIYLSIYLSIYIYIYVHMHRKTDVLYYTYMLIFFWYSSLGRYGLVVFQNQSKIGSSKNN